MVPINVRYPAPESYRSSHEFEMAQWAFSGLGGALLVRLEVKSTVTQFFPQSHDAKVHAKVRFHA